jgi:hypothetical protein
MRRLRFSAFGSLVVMLFATTARAQTPDPVGLQFPWVQFGVGTGLAMVPSAGVMRGLFSAHGGIGVARDFSAELALDGWTFDADSLRAFYGLQLRMRLPLRLTQASAWFSAGVGGRYDSNRRPGFEYARADLSRVRQAAYTHRTLTAPDSVVVGFGIQQALAAHLALRADVRYFLTGDGALLAATMGIAVPFGER